MGGMTIRAVAIGLALGVAGGWAQTAAPGADGKKAVPRIVLPSDRPAGKGAADAKAKSGAAPAAAPGKAAPKKEEPPPKIDGMEIARTSKGFLGIEIKNGMYRLSFYDEKKKPAAPDVERAALRWDPKYKVGQERVVLTAGGDGKSLGSDRNIRPPYQFKLFITLLKDGPDGQAAAVENYTVDFRQ
jgi:hypothetical protein